MLPSFAVCLVAAASLGANTPRGVGYDEIVNGVLAADTENEVRQTVLSRRTSVLDYKDFVRCVNGTNVWTAALQKAIDENSIIVVPPSRHAYWLDGTVVVPSDRRIEAKGATISLLPGTTTVMLRNEHVVDETLSPAGGERRDANIAIVGGRWTDWVGHRAGYGKSGRYDSLCRATGKYYGVSSLFLFSGCNHLTLKDLTFEGASAFAVQIGCANSVTCKGIRFSACYADGLHVNGNVSLMHVQGVRGVVGDDLVALNAYDWLNSSINYGPQRDIICEDLVHEGGGYPAIRIQPGCFRFADKSVVDCSVSRVIFRRVKGITTFKMYLQTMPYPIGTEHEWGAVGSGGDIWFEDVDIDLSGPIDKIGQYAESEDVRGHFGAFEFGANLSRVVLRRVAINFHLDQWPLSHLAVVGPKSIVTFKDGKPEWETFDPWVDCRIGSLILSDVSVSGKVPSELVRTTKFDNVNGDNCSSGSGAVDRLEIGTITTNQLWFVDGVISRRLQ